MHPATIVILLILLSFGLKYEEKEYVGFCFTIALITSGIIGGICRSEQVAYTVFGIVFALLITAPSLENFYIKLFSLIKQFIKYILK